MFLRGAYAANRFNHPRVVPVTTDGTDPEGQPFVVRAWAEAEPLATRIGREGPATEAWVLRMAEQVLDALEMAHAHGIVHGAIHPSNILVTPRGSIRLCDFATPPGMGPRNLEEEDLLADRRVGPFTPPERAARPIAPPSEQSDIYAVGACMVFALSGKAPRGDAKISEALATTAATPLRELASTASEAVASLVDHALALEPEERYVSAYAMLGDVRRIMAGRKPKLGDAQNPVPSGSYSGLPIGPTSNLRSVPGRDYFHASTYSGMRTTADQWRGNLLLILAIALLVGVATYVMVREKMQDAHPAETSAPAR
jgi:serine/threonine-protein kinase